MVGETCSGESAVVDLLHELVVNEEVCSAILIVVHSSDVYELLGGGYEILEGSGGCPVSAATTGNNLESETVESSFVREVEVYYDVLVYTVLLGVINLGEGVVDVVVTVCTEVIHCGSNEILLVEHVAVGSGDEVGATSANVTPGNGVLVAVGGGNSGTVKKVGAKAVVGVLDCIKNLAAVSIGNRGIAIEKLAYI